MISIMIIPGGSTPTKHLSEMSTGAAERAYVRSCEDGAYTCTSLRM